MSDKPNKNATEYAQNLSHELLTPLAVIRSKAEILLQSPNLKSEDLKNLDAIIKNVARMNSLNRSLILLSKIDNKVYADRTTVNLKEVCEEALENYEDQIRTKSLQIRFKVENEVITSSNKTLIDILINNLLKNALIHNIKEGELMVKLTSNSVEIKNTIDPNFPPPKNQFKRFTTSKGDTGSIGLGLSIVKRISKFLDIELRVDISASHYSTVLVF